MKVNNVELRDIDVYDADDMEVFEEGLKELSEKAEQLKELTITNAESIRYQCNAIFDFVNKVFGEDTDVKLFGSKTNLRVCTEALLEIINNVTSKQKKDGSKVNLYIGRLNK